MELSYDRRITLASKYSLTPEEYLSMLEDQCYACKICGDSIRDEGKAQVDHDHKTDLIRGLLCFKCNSALGLFRDSTRLLAAAIVYLEENR